MKYLLIFILVLSCKSDPYEGADRSISHFVIAKNCLEKLPRINMLLQASITEGMNCLNLINSRFKNHYLAEVINRKSDLYLNCDQDFKLNKSDVVEYKKEILFSKTLMFIDTKIRKDVPRACAHECFAYKSLFDQSFNEEQRRLCLGK